MSESSRKEFEEWCPYTDVEENYAHREALYEAWIASRRAVRLPERKYINVQGGKYEAGFNECLDEIRKELGVEE